MQSFNAIRILHVFGIMNRGGAETMIMNLYRNIDRQRYLFDFVVHTEAEGDYDREIQDLGGRIYHIPRYTAKTMFSYRRQWVIFFRDHPEYFIVHGHVRSTASIYLKQARRFGRRAIAHSHNTSSGRGMASLAKNILQSDIRNHADYFLACSRDAGEWLFGKSVLESETFTILNNAIDAKAFHYDAEVREKKRKELHIDGAFVVGHIGRFDDQKNHLFLLDIFQKIVDRCPLAVLVMVGDGRNRVKIENRIRELALNGKVLLLGVRSDISDLLQAMDVFLFPSLHEGLPVSLVEAQAAGLSCIVSDVITDEAIITGLVDKISLEAPPDVWAAKALQNRRTIDRASVTPCIAEAGFDIARNAEFIQKFYSGIIMDNGRGR